MSQKPIRLQLLGSLDLQDPAGREIRDVLRRPKAVAILSYLLLARPRGYHRRELLLPVFWPESDEGSARHALSQQIYELRRSLGRHVLSKLRGEANVGVVPGTVWCDALEFEAALDAGDLERALELYGGPLLQGFHLDDSHEFEDWLHIERERLDRAAYDAAITLAERGREVPDHDQVARWARRALEIRPYDQRAIQRLLIALEATGDWAGGLRAYETFLRAFETQFDAAPSAQTRELVERCRPAAAVPQISNDSNSTPPRNAQVLPAARAPSPTVTQPDSTPTPWRPALLPARGKSHRRRVVAVLVAAAGIALIGTALRGNGTPNAEPPLNRVAVLFFEDASEQGDLRDEAAALNTGMIEQLSDLGPLDVIPQSGVRQYRNSDVDPSIVREELRAGFVVAGTLTRSNERLRAFVEVIDAVSGVAQNGTVEVAGGELFAMVDSATERVLSFVRPTIGAQLRRRTWRRETDNDEAWRLTFEVEDLVDRSRERESAGDFQAAFALMSRADTLLALAMSLDPRWAQPLVTLANLVARGATMALAEPHELDTGATDLDRAIALTAAALDLDENSPATHEARGILLHRKWVLLRTPGATGDSLLTDEVANAVLASAEQHLLSALRLHSVRPRAESTLSAVYYAQGRFGDARRAAERAYYLDRYQLDIDQIVLRLFQASFEDGRDDAAQDWCDEVGRLMPERLPAAHCRLVLHVWGQRSRHDLEQALHLRANAGLAESAAARDLLGPTLDLLLAAAIARAGLPDSARAIIERTEVPPRDLTALEAEAAAWVVLGDHDQAIRCIAALLASRPASRARIGATREFRPLRTDPRFVDLTALADRSDPRQSQNQTPSTR